MKKQALLMLAITLWSVSPLYSQGFRGIGIAIKAISLGQKSMELSERTSPAVFPYGRESLNKYIYRHLPLPSMQAEFGQDMATADVVMQFTIDPRGKVTDVKNISAPHVGLADELTGIFRRMPRWIPALNKSQPQQSTHRYKVHIVLKDDLYDKPYIYCEPVPCQLMAEEL